jgi:hypothetical protein
MKNNRAFYLIIFLVLMSGSCQNNINAVKDSECNRFITDSESNLSKLPSDAFSLNSFFIAGDFLTASVSYSGGCEEHCFNLAWNAMIMESYPPQTVLILSHDSKNDNCREYINDNIRINISDFKKKLTSSNIREISIKITDKTYLYKF